MVRTANCPIGVYGNITLTKLPAARRHMKKQLQLFCSKRMQLGWFFYSAGTCCITFESIWEKWQRMSCTYCEEVVLLWSA